MTLKERMTKLREDDPLFTVARLVEITIYGDRQDREDDFLSVAAKILHVPQAEVDEAIFFTREAPTQSIDFNEKVDPRTQVDPKIPVLDHGYVELIEAWGHGKAGRCNGAAYLMDGSDDDNEVGIVEAARQSTQGSFRGWETDVKLLTSLFNNEPPHSSPFEFAGMTIEVQAPIMVFREWQRHRTQSYNEMSARYAPLPDLYYNPPLSEVLARAEAAQTTKNRQLGAAANSMLDTEEIAVWLDQDTKLQAVLENHYRYGLQVGVPKELARKRMPVDHYSRMRATANLTNWIRFLTLRLPEGVMWEMRLYAQAVLTVFANTFPHTHELFTTRLGENWKLKNWEREQ